MPYLVDHTLEQKSMRTEPSSSAFVLLAGLNKRIPSLAHHNVFFSPNYKREFEQIFEEKTYPDESTIYICNSSKTELARSPHGDNLLVLVNAPAGKTPPAHYDDFLIKQLERYNIYLENAIVQKQIISPQTIEQDFYSYKGALYGSASNDFRSAFFRPSNKSSMASNLYFVGGMHVANATATHHRPTS